MQKNFILPNNDLVAFCSKHCIIKFNNKMKVLSTSAHNGGINTHIKTIYNYNNCDKGGICAPMNGNNIKEHQKNIMKILGLDEATTCGLDTAVNINNMSISTKNYKDLSVTSIITAGANSNALCAGDTANLIEIDNCPSLINPGTINIILIINQPLTDGALIEAMMTATEAKSHVLSKFLQGSTISKNIATGTGTDGIIIASPLSEKSKDLFNAGKHFKLGELIGKSVIEATTDSLFKQTGFSPSSQHTVTNKLRRFGYKESYIYEKIKENHKIDILRFQNLYDHINTDGYVVSLASLYSHLLDQLLSSMLTEQEVNMWCNTLINLTLKHYNINENKIYSIMDSDDLTLLFMDTISYILTTYLNEENRLYK